MLGKTMLFVVLAPLTLALACGIFDDQQSTPVEADPEPRPRVAEQVPDLLRCDVEMRRFLAGDTIWVATADGANVGVSYVQSQYAENCPPSRWNPRVSEVAVDDDGNIDLSFALPSVATDGNPVTTTGEGTLRWVYLAADSRWYAAPPDHPTVPGETRPEDRETTAGVTAPTATPMPEPTATPVSDRDVYEAAYASCNGYYRGVEITRRKQMARLKSLEGLRDSLRRNCEGAVEEVAAALGVTPAPVPTWPPTAALLPTWTPVPTPTVVPWRTVTPPTRTSPSWTAPPTPTPKPAESTSVSPPQQPTRAPTTGSNASLHRLMLDLTNDRRAAAGVPKVRMGHNRAAQLHTEAALAGCYSGHWDQWGLKPNHRYTLTGGTGGDAENMSGHRYCTKESDNYAPISSMEEKVTETVQRWMDSPSHRRNLLNPAHTVLNIGIAHDRYRTAMAQHFSSDYVRYRQRPTISTDGTLTLSATVSRATLDIGRSVNIQVAYEKPPKPLTRGQLSYTYALCGPTPVAYVVKPLPEGSHYTDDGTNRQTIPRKCVDPYLTPANRRPPSNSQESHQAWKDAKSASDRAPDITVITVRIIADTMSISNSSISAKADLSRILERYGPGIYTILLWGRPDHMTKHVPLSKQAIFWKTRPPPGAPY